MHQCRRKLAVYPVQSAMKQSAGHPKGQSAKSGKKCLCRAIVVLLSEPTQYAHISILSKICSTSAFAKKPHSGKNQHRFPTKCSDKTHGSMHCGISRGICTWQAPKWGPLEPDSYAHHRDPWSRLSQASRAVM